MDLFQHIKSIIPQNTEQYISGYHIEVLRVNFVFIKKYNVVFKSKAALWRYMKKHGNNLFSYNRFLKDIKNMNEYYGFNSKIIDYNLHIWRVERIKKK